MRFGVLGPLAVWGEDGEPVHVPETKVRALLADLLVHEGRPVPADRLIEDVWGRATPASTLQARISQLRRALGDPGAIVLGPAGYRLTAADVDAGRFLALAAARTGTPRERAARLEEALALWRGPAYADFADFDFARPEIARLEEARLSAFEELAEVRQALGEPVEVADLVAAHPLRERLRAVHMKALYRAGRQSEALASYRQLRTLLADELGLDPSPEIVAVHEAILRQDPALAPPGAASSLPAPLTDMIGRQPQVRDVSALLETFRLVTLTGSGGVGKTRLALEIAWHVTGSPAAGARGSVAFPDGVWLVELAGAADVAEAVAAALGMRDDSAAPLAERLASGLAARRMLLVLDNCEHVIEQVAALTSGLLRAAPGLRVLATSQEPVGITGERVSVVPPLSERDATRLLATRAGVAEDDTLRVISRRLDGIPLALELAAPRVRALGAEELAGRLGSPGGEADGRRADERFRLLSSGMRDAPARQRTLRAVLDWSWELLPPSERIVLRRLAAHADGCTLEAAETVCAEPGVDVVDALVRLVDRSLVVSRGSRFLLLESVAAYAAERLAEAGEREPVAERHARYYTELAERADLRGHGQRQWLQRLDAESANLRLATRGPYALRLVNALAWYWFLRGRLGEARRTLAAVLERGGQAEEVALATVWHAGIAMSVGEAAPAVRHDHLDAAGRALADWFLTHVRWAYGDFHEHERRVTGALDTFTAQGDRWGMAAALSLRAKYAGGRGDLAAMERDGRRSLAVFRELGDGWGQIEAMDTLDRLAEIRGEYDEATRLRVRGLGLAEELGFETANKLSAIGRSALLAGDYERADDYHERARRLAVEQSYKGAEEHAALGLAVSARRQGRYAEAEAYVRPWLAWLREVDGLPGIAFLMAELGFAAEQRGDAELALARQCESYQAARRTGDPRAIALSLEGLAGALSLSGRAQEAARSLGAAEGIRNLVGAPLPGAERLDVNRISARLTELLGAEAFAEVRRSGQRELGDHLPGALRGRAGV
ncbi:BTAD domain-containing putative transcriptional regulator [Nonomuraea sp. NPDC050536]|uniref:BTAD domain-containing putative transcriptional regulator n=1 Tax=Nonomuraea sp. NPDC050536 TaxID=3364366 RepID=UPI0037C6A30D